MEIIIWGTGRRAKKFMETAIALAETSKELLENNMLAVCCFIDSDKNKQGTFFYDKPVCSYEDAIKKWGGAEIVIAIAAYKEIERFLTDARKRFSTDSDCLRKLRQDFIAQREVVLQKFGISRFSGALQSVPEKYVRCVYIADYLIRWRDTEYSQELFLEICALFSPVDIVFAANFIWVDGIHDMLAFLLRKQKHTEAQQKRYKDRRHLQSQIL